MRTTPAFRLFLTLVALLPLASARASAAGAMPPLAAHYDLVVYGATPGGVACAVRGAREGLTVLVVSPWEHLGGALTNGLTTMDTLYNGARAPLYDELRQSIHDHYRAAYGADSEQYHRTLPGQPKAKTEARVFEKLITGMLERERGITIVRRYYPIAVDQKDTLLRTVTFRSMEGERTFSVGGFSFADCSYEGDLAAVAGVPYRVGREARSEFNEEHAGRIFMTKSQWPAPAHVDPAYIADYRRLNLSHYNRWYDIIRPASTGVADPTVQAYNLRTIITRDPANRLPVEKPEGYDREALLLRLKHDINWSTTSVPSPNQPNEKTYLNLPELVGLQRDYPLGDWATRRRIIAEHAFITRGLLYFMQNDPSVDEKVRAGWRAWGLPRDEFADNGHLPHEIYVREARRIEGRGVMFSENDARPAPGLKRAPVYADSISITEWFLDSHACTPEHVPGSMFEGELLLNHITVPGQISFRTILPQGVDNLLVPVCASSTHIGWGAIRLEPTWMSLGEAAAYAVVLAKERNQAPALINPDELVRRLAAGRIMLSFFNDVEVDPRESWVPAVQYFGTQGFFGSYDAQPLGPVSTTLAEAWSAAAAELITGKPGDPTERARRMLAVERDQADALTVEQFLVIFSRALTRAGVTHSVPALRQQVQLANEVRISRGNACRLMLAVSR